MRLAALTAMSALAAHAADVTFFDAIFNIANWTGTKVVDTSGGSSSFTATQPANGGNPGPYRQIDQVTATGMTYVAHQRTSFSYNPSSQGAISTVDFLYDSEEVSAASPSGATAVLILLVFQNNTYYVTNFSDLFTPGWSHFIRAGLSSGSFHPLQGSTLEHPDFSSAGAPIQFGFYTVTTTPGTTHLGVDNFTVTLHTAEADSRRLLPQFVFGGGWYSALYFANTSTTAASFNVDFISDAGTPLTVPSVGGITTLVKIGPGETAIVEAPNQGALQQGYVSFPLKDGVIAYAVFRQSVPDIPDQEAVVPLANAASTAATMIWDDVNSITAVSLVNQSSALGAIQVTVRDASGTVLAGPSLLSLPAKNKIAVALRDLLPGFAVVAGKRGSVDFQAVTGTVSVLGIRFHGSAFTSIPAVER
ncbi:MAG: hypothetical protein ABI823_19100 [Bryobacteraceae bacterium]